MAIDPNIILGIRPVRINQQDPMEQYAKGLTLKNLMAQSEMQDIAMADEQATRAAYQQAGGDPAKARALLAQGGQYKQVQALDKSALETQEKQSTIRRNEAAAAKAEFDKTMESISRISSVLNTAKDQASYAIAREQLARTFGPKMLDNMPEQYDPAFIQAQIAQGQTLAQSLADQRAREGQKITIRGQDIADTRGRENAAALRDQAQATRDAAKLQRDRDTEMKLADDYRTQSKNFKEVADAYGQISKTLDKATTSPAATLAAATKFMKLLDPGSVVRESELGMALAASGVFDRAFNYYNTLAKGKVLTPQQAADFKNITSQIYQAAQQSQQMIDADFARKAQTYGLRPEMVTQDLGQSKPTGGIKFLGFE